MDVKIKKLSEDAVIPKYALEGDAGMDLTAISRYHDEYGNLCYGTGLAIEIPEDYEGELRPRSSISKYELVLVNSPGTIDSNYRGEIILKFKILHGGFYKREGKTAYDVGERVAQLLIKPAPHFKLVEVSKLSETNRGAGAYGHTGK